MAYSSPFYHASKCKAAARGKAYGDLGFRDDSVLKWLYRKIAYVNASVYNEKNGGSGTLSTPTAGGLDGAGVYTSGKQSGDGVHIPKPTIDSVVISTEGDLGSILKCELKFIVFGLGQLNANQHFFDLGAELTVNYGWEDLGSGYGSHGQFKGTIYNFAYSVRSGGGFDCSVSAMSKGISALAGSIKASSAPESTYQDPLGNTIPTTDLLTTITGYVKAAEKVASNNTGADDIGMIEIAETSETKESGGKASSKKGQAEKKYFVSLKKIVELIQSKVLKAAGGDQMAKFKIVCDGDTTKGPIPSDASLLVSANPLECVFPGYGTYGATKYDFNASGFAGQFKGNDLSVIMIGVDWLTDMINKLGGKTDDRSRSADVSISQFLKNIFDMIYQNSGTRFQLSCAQDITDPDGKTFLVVDVNYIDTTVGALSLAAVTNGGFCRTLSLASKVPSEMQAAAYVGNKSTLTGTSSDIGKATGKSTVPDWGSITTDLDSAKKAIDKGGVNETYVNQLRSTLRAAFIFNGDGKDNHAPLFPLSLSATVDGIEGFQFGDAVTTNYMPSQYIGNVAFAVTKVTHNISGGDWTTSVDTVCRLLPK